MHAYHCLGLPSPLFASSLLQNSTASPAGNKRKTFDRWSAYISRQRFEAIVAMQTFIVHYKDPAAACIQGSLPPQHKWYDWCFCYSYLCCGNGPFLCSTFQASIHNTSAKPSATINASEPIANARQAGFWPSPACIGIHDIAQVAKALLYMLSYVIQKTKENELLD